MSHAFTPTVDHAKSDRLLVDQFGERPTASNITTMQMSPLDLLPRG
jgi:hypothetical protein